MQDATPAPSSGTPPTPSVWTSVDVTAEAFADTRAQDIERLMDALAEHYYGRSRLVRRFVEPVVCGSLIEKRPSVAVNGFPAWMPLWLARRNVARMAASLGLNVAITAHRETTVMH